MAVIFSPLCSGLAAWDTRRKLLIEQYGRGIGSEAYSKYKDSGANFAQLKGQRESLEIQY